MSVNFKPLADRVLVEPAEREERTESGLFVPESAAAKPQEGTIIAVGEGRRTPKGDRVALEVSAGDTIVFAKFAGTEIKLDGKKLLILKEADILAVIE